MRGKENARSTAATVKRAEAAVFSGAAASFAGEHNTLSGSRQVTVADVLPHGAGNAVDGQTLATAMGFKSVRELSREIQRERLAGAPICAAVSGDSKGYFLASSPTELSAYLRSLDRRICEVRKTHEAICDTLRRMTGQEILRGW